LSFINALTPVSYQFTGDDITHYGIIAQDTEEVLATTFDKGLSDFGGIVVDDGGNYGANYSEFICPLIKAVQELSTQNKMLQQQMQDRDDTIALFEERFRRLERMISKKNSISSDEDEWEVPEEE
jgi:hypothetical protein